MRRPIAAALVAVATALSVVTGSSVAAVDGEPTGPAAAAEQVATDEQADQALATVTRLLSGRGAQRVGAAGPADLSLAMRDLFVALPRLDADERARAEELMARPTDGSGDRLGDGYTVPAAKKCGGNFCVHYVTSSADAAPSTSWVGYTLSQMNKVWKQEIRRMEFRKPLSDQALGAGDNGGNARFDIYLKDLGSRGLYGYCVPEAGLRGKKYKWRAISYCVLDNDFSPAQFGTAPKPTLKVTAAHEFFHAVQFSYDYGEDRWLLESTATWMEERFADQVDDNRQYLPASQVRAPWLPLDTFTRTGSNQYGNWVFWEYLSSRFGQRIVRDIWSETAPHGSRNTYAIATVKKELRRRGGFEKVYGTFAATNLFPGRAYREGGAWPTPGLLADVALTKASRSVARSATVPHLSAHHVRVRPAKSLNSKRWRLRVSVDGPNRSSSPSVVVTVQKKSGKLVRTTVRLNKSGKGRTSVPFSRKLVRSVTATAVNASTRFRCYEQDPSADPLYSCQGVPRDDSRVFALKLKAVKR